MGIRCSICQESRCLGELNVENIQQTKQQSEKIEIYYSCLRIPKCEKSSISKPFLHRSCNKKAWLYPNGEVDCEGSCTSFDITYADFNCEKNTIGQISYYQKNYEIIKTMIEFSDFIKNCLDHSNLCVEEQLSFQKRVFDSDYFQHLIKKKI